jgi:penicillin-binding protein 1A
MNLLLGFLRWGAAAAFGFLTLLVLAVAGAYLHVASDMPEVETLREVRLQVPLRVYSRDGLLLAEYGEQRRQPVAIDQVPHRLKQAFLAAEDDRFYSHPGVDYHGLLRAAHNLLTTGEKTQGGSTITMQVARNFFLNREKTYTRKLTEIFLAFKIERELTKDEIFELYLNKIYLGQRAYGVSAAAQVYYGGDLESLSLAQMAMIAGLPKAPSASNPVSNPQRALARRHYVLGRMRDLGYITESEFQEARDAPVTARLHNPIVEIDAAYVGEIARMEMLARFGESAYTDGYRVITTVDSRLQGAANQALRAGLSSYDRRHGYRGPETTVDLKLHSDQVAWDALLSQIARVGGELWPGIVTAASAEAATVYLGSGQAATLKLDAVAWAKPYIDESRMGAEPKNVTDVLKPGQVVRLRREGSGDDGRWVLAQVPEVAGALVSLDPSDGAVLALVGGFDFYQSSFNRATQAERQPGSAFKPFIYSAALERGYSPASIVNDAPVVFEDRALEGTWRPENYTGRFYGPTRLREALAHSRNLVSIRVLHAIGVRYVHDYIARFGFDMARQPRNLSLSLGSGSVTPLELTTGYAVFANGGYRVKPWIIERIEDATGRIVHRETPSRVCDPPCLEATLPDGRLAAVGTAGMDEVLPGQEQPAWVPAERVISPSNAFQMTSMMRDVVEDGTARRALSLGRGISPARPARPTTCGTRGSAASTATSSPPSGSVSTGPRRSASARRGLPRPCPSGWSSRRRRWRVGPSGPSNRRRA